MTKKNKINNKTNKETEKNDTILAIIYALIIFGILIALVLTVTSRPTKTLYITANHFPIRVVAGNLNENTTEYIFYGTLQPNGTECISSVETDIYSYNYTTQSLSPTPQITNVTNPKEVSEIYYYYATLGGNNVIVVVNSSGISTNIFIPEGYTLLCPDIVNATR